MSIVLITGSCGLVGSESVEFFSSKGFDVVGIDNNSRLKFFGKDGDINWIKSSLIKSYKNYIHMNIDIRNEEVVQILERMTCPDCQALDGCETYQSETKIVLECRYCEFSQEVLR